MPNNFMVLQNSFTRSEMKQGLHTEYEKQLLKEFILNQILELNNLGNPVILSHLWSLTTGIVSSRSWIPGIVSFRSVTTGIANLRSLSQK